MGLYLLLDVVNDDVIYDVSRNDAILKGENNEYR